MLEELFSLLAPFLTALMGLFPPVAAAGIFISAIVNLVKLINKIRPGTLPDGSAGVISLALNAICWCWLWFAGPVLGSEEAIAVLGEAGEIATLIVTLLMSLVASKAGHLIFKWLGLATSLSKPTGVAG
jgi:hypothetical protein